MSLFIFFTRTCQCTSKPCLFPSAGEGSNAERVGIEPHTETMTLCLESVLWVERLNEF